MRTIHEVPVQNADNATTFKLLGVVISHTLSWDDHITAITAKAAKRMRFLKKLKRAGVSTEDLTYYYQAVIRPVLEYASPAWHSSLTKGQTKALEDVQRRAFQIISNNVPYEDACSLLKLCSLAERRLELSRTVYQQIARVTRAPLPASSKA